MFILKESNQSHENSVSIEFTEEEWSELKKYISLRGVRKSFLIGFHRILAKKLQSQGIKCYLSCKSNWFSSKNIKKWSGLYKCSDPDCKILYKAELDIKNDRYLIIISWNDTYSHLNYINPSLKLRCVGEKRKSLGFRIMSEGIANIKAKNTIDFYDKANKSIHFFNSIGNPHHATKKGLPSYEDSPLCK